MRAARAAPSLVVAIALQLLTGVRAAEYTLQVAENTLPPTDAELVIGTVRLQLPLFAHSDERECLCASFPILRIPCLRVHVHTRVSQFHTNVFHRSFRQRAPSACSSRHP